MRRPASLTLAITTAALVLLAHHEFFRLLATIVDAVEAMPASRGTWIVLGLLVAAAAAILAHLTHLLWRLLEKRDH